MNKIKKAVWFSVFLTGAGQFYLGEKKKGWGFLMFSIFGIVVTSIGAVLILDIFLGLITLTHYKILFPLGVFLSIIGLALIVIPGYRSIKEITSRAQNDKKRA